MVLFLLRTMETWFAFCCRENLRVRPYDDCVHLMVSFCVYLVTVLRLTLLFSRKNGNGIDEVFTNMAACRVPAAAMPPADPQHKADTPLEPLQAVNRTI
jgi:hypothetical protein